MAWVFLPGVGDDVISAGAFERWLMVFTSGMVWVTCHFRGPENALLEVKSLKKREIKTRKKFAGAGPAR
jgi:hypothetical protein